MSVPERPSSTYVPPPPPAKQSDVKRPPLATAPPAPPRMDVPSNGGNAFIPPPPAMKQANGKVPPTRIFDVPADQPMSDQPHASMQKPTDLGGGAAKAPVPFLATTPMIGLAQSPNPFAPYCGPDNELTPASALCRAAGEAGLSDYCRQQLLAFLGSKSEQTLGSWIAAQELCDQAALRRAVGIAEASIAAKTSAGLFDKPGFGNPFGVDGYAWKQDRVVTNAGVSDDDKSTGIGGPMRIGGIGLPFQGSPYTTKNRLAPKGNGATMDWRSPGVHGWLNPSGGMPNYYRASGYVGNPTREEWIANAGDPEQWDASFGADDATNGGGASGGGGMTSAEKGRLTAAQTADAFARGRDNPPTNYAAIIGSASQAVGGIIAGINTAVQNGENNRLRELELTFNNTARSAELALRARQVELQGEIARIRASAPAAAADPATTALIQRLEQQGNEYRTAIQRQEAAAAEAAKGMGTGTVVAIVGGAVVVLGIGAYALMGGGRRR